MNHQGGSVKSINIESDKYGLAQTVLLQIVCMFEKESVFIKEMISYDIVRRIDYKDNRIKAKL